MRLLYSVILVAFGLGTHCTSYGQAKKSATATSRQFKDKAVKAYTVAIGEYINAVYKPGTPRPDTLFVNKNPDMPDIKLPISIQGINVVILPGNKSAAILRNRPSSVLLNIPSWLSGDKPELLIIAFSNLKPQHNCSIHLKYNTARTNFVLDSLSFDYPYTHIK